jgi:hypothetical protein
MAISRSIWAAHSRTVALRRAPSLDYLAANTTHRSTPMIEANSRVTSVVIILNVLRPKHSRNSSQGQTADRVLIHVDTDKSELLVNDRFAYVSVSRAQHDAHIYTNDASKLPHSLSRESSQRTATEADQQSVAPRIEPTFARPTNPTEQEQAQSVGIGLS